MYPELPCIYCNSKSTLIEGEIILQKGLHKTKSKSSHYKCTICKREFQTHEQKMAVESEINSRKIRYFTGPTSVILEPNEKKDEQTKP